ncbi:class II fructose-bisphosphatase [Magnetospira sp. QH-2]|uniref:class II fructose-bisphosphatase n=1 Tax=Magnetospira sp. (strain QH-2) TaxID=1288970 RepID=UPI0003E81162|nr:class II fructose-bisphosphatase [Magnetospira sp. QH-2]CCQ73665.1 Fructose 1,6-bisphosphatase II [Magnetospira sp. QH-2]
MMETDRPLSSHLNLAMDTVQVTEIAALAAGAWMGRGDEMAADGAAAAAMGAAIARLELDGKVVIGEFGDGASSSFCPGERVGGGVGPRVDIALTPLEGITACARGTANALSVMALTDAGGLLPVPEVYMDKIAVGPGLPEGIIDLEAEPEDNLKRVAEARGIAVPDLVVCILDRPRHEELIWRVREAGARIMLFADGDVSGIMATLEPESGVDMYMGIGGAPQGVLAAAALRCVGGQMQGKLLLRTNEDHTKAREMGLSDPSRIFSAADMASGDIMLAATGVTRSVLLRGVRRSGDSAVTHSLVMRSATGTLRYLQSRHSLDAAGDPLTGA